MLARKLLALGLLCPIELFASLAIAEEPPASSNDPSVPFADIPLYDKSPTEAEKARPQEISEPLQPKQDWSPEATNAFNEILYVQNLGDPERIVFEGVTLFPEEQLRRALALDLKYQAAARPSNETGDFLDTLERRLREGYLHSGCRDAKVTAHRDGSRNAVVVQVEEGPRYRMGEIRVVGSAFVDERALAKWLTTPQAPRPWRYIRDSEYVECGWGDKKLTAWSRGKPTQFDSLALEELQNVIWVALAEMGFPYTKFLVELAPNSQTGSAELVIEILDDQPQSTVGMIGVGDSDREWDATDKDQLLSYLRLAPGASFSASLLEDINGKLKDSGRFMTRSIYVYLRSKSLAIESPRQNRLGLALELKKYESAPPLGQPLDPVDEVLRKSAKWLESIEDRDQDFVVKCDARIGNERISKACNIRLVISSRGIASELKGSPNESWAFNHSFIVSPNNVEFVDWDSRQKFVVSQPLATRRLKYRVNMQPKQLKLGAAFASEDETTSTPMRSTAEIQIDPASLTAMAHFPDTNASIANGVLTIKSSRAEFRFEEATGKFLSFKTLDHEGSPFSTISAKIEKGAYERALANIHRRGANLPNQFDEERPVSSTVSFAIRQLAQQPLIQKKPGLSALFDALATAVTNSEWPYDGSQTIPYLPAIDSTHSEGFAIPRRHRPTDDITTYVDRAATITIALNDELFARGSWPWTLIRQYALYERQSPNEELSDTAHAEWNVVLREELNRLLRSGEIGPIGHLALAKSYQTTHPEFAATLSQYGLANLSAETFLKDVYAITAEDQWLPSVVCAAVEELGNVSRDKQQQCIAMVPVTMRAPLERFMTRRQSRPDEAPDVAIRESLLESWQIGLRETIEAELRNISASAQLAAETDDATAR